MQQAISNCSLARMLKTESLQTPNTMRSCTLRPNGSKPYCATILPTIAIEPSLTSPPSPPPLPPPPPPPSSPHPHPHVTSRRLFPPQPSLPPIRPPTRAPQHPSDDSATADCLVLVHSNSLCGDAPSERDLLHYLSPPNRYFGSCSKTTIWCVPMDTWISGIIGEHVWNGLG